MANGKTAQRRFCTFRLKWSSAAPAALVRGGNERVLYRAREMRRLPQGLEATCRRA
jgi:hypothetical protein